MTTVGWYRAHGLLFQSEVLLPEFIPADVGVPDVRICLDPLVRCYRDEVADGAGGEAGFMSTEKGPVLRVEGVADFLVRDGREIRIGLCPSHDPGLVRLFLAGSATGMILHQRRYLPLHGAAVLGPEGVSIIIGESGAGKSTLAAALAEMGIAILTDDTIALRKTSEGFAAWPGSRVFKLWKDSLAQVGHAGMILEQAGARIDKFLIRNRKPAADKPHQVASIIELAVKDGEAKYEGSEGVGCSRGGISARLPTRIREVAGMEGGTI